MLSYEMEMIRDRLVRSGYIRHRVERMKPWVLLDCLRHEKAKLGAGFHSSQTLPQPESLYVNSSMLSEMWEETVIKTARSNLLKSYRSNK